MITSITIQSRWNKKYLSVKNPSNYAEKDLNSLESEIQNEIDRMQTLKKIVKVLNENLSTELVASKIISVSGIEPIVTVKTKSKRTYYIGGLTIHEEDVSRKIKKITEDEFVMHLKTWGCDLAQSDYPKEYKKYMKQVKI